MRWPDSRLKPTWEGTAAYNPSLTTGAELAGVVVEEPCSGLSMLDPEQSVRQCDCSPNTVRRRAFSPAEPTFWCSFAAVFGPPSGVIDVKEIPALDEIAWDEASGLTIGAAAPCYRIYENEDVKKHYPGLIDVASLIGGTQIQGRASLGGNLCNAAPSADAVPIMIALEASCCIAGPNGDGERSPWRTSAWPRARECPRCGRVARFPAFPRAESEFRCSLPYGSSLATRWTSPSREPAFSVVLANGNFASARVALASVAPTPLFVKQAW